MIGVRTACICLCRPCNAPVVCISLVCYGLDGKRGPCDEALHELEWSDDDRRGEICLGFADGIKSDIDEAEGPAIDDVLEETGYADVEELVADVETCCDGIINAVVAGRCDPTPEQRHCLETAAKLADWFDDENLEEGALLYAQCEPEEEVEPDLELTEVLTPEARRAAEAPPPPPPGSPGDSPANAIAVRGLFERGPFVGTDGRWFRVIGGL